MSENDHETRTLRLSQHVTAAIMAIDAIRDDDDATPRDRIAAMKKIDAHLTQAWGEQMVIAERDATSWEERYR